MLVLKKVALLLTLVLTLFSYTVFADNNDINNEEINNILSSKEEQDTFNNTIANSQDDKNISIKAHEKKNKDNLNSKNEEMHTNVHPSENIKIHAFTTMKPSDFYNEYEKSQNLNNFISPNHSIITVFRDNNLFMDSIFYLKPETAEQKDSKWEAVSSGAMIFSDETIEFFSKEKNIKDLFQSINIKQPKDLKIVVGIDGIEGLLYFKENGNEIVVPLSDGYKFNEDITVCKKFTPYLANEFFEARKLSALENEKKLEQWEALPMGEKTYGSNADINYVNLKSVDLSTLAPLNIADKTSPSPSESNNYAAFIVIIVLLGGSVILGNKYFAKIYRQ